MLYNYEKRFWKSFDKLSPKIQDGVANAIELFREDPNCASLRNHKLSGKLKDIWSISAGGDIRIHYQEFQNGDIIIIFLDVGTHSQLY